ncbi:cellulase family glycosylhydrolase, partial [Coraliomargarita sp. SDUM461004]
MKIYLKYLLIALVPFLPLRNSALANSDDFSWEISLVGAKVHRGVNSGSWLGEWDFTNLNTWGNRISLLRLQLLGDQFEPILNSEGEWTFSDLGWEILDALLANARKKSIKVLIDMHRTRDFYERNHSAADWGSQENRDKLSSIWRSIAKRYRNHRGVIAGYDILNEPCPPNNIEGYDMWNQTFAEVTAAIREYDTYHTIIVESAGFASATTFDFLVPTDDENTIYSFHFYDPHEFSEQGTRDEWPFGDDGVSGYVYPGVVPLGWSTKVDTLVDKAYLSSQLEPVRRFQATHGCRIYVGEFGSVRWAPTKAGEVHSSSYFWLRDALDLFEAEGWDWTQHSYRLGAPYTYGIEHSTDREDISRDPDSNFLKLFANYWGTITESSQILLDDRYVIALPSALQVDPRIIDDSQPEQLSIRWEQISGPSGLLFSDIHSLSPEITFEQAGSYELRLSVNGFSASTQVEVWDIPFPYGLPGSVFLGQSDFISHNSSQDLSGGIIVDSDASA